MRKLTERMDNQIERRHHKRLKHNTIVTLESLQIGVNDNNRMGNCSDNGLYFESNQFLQPGENVFIQVENYSNEEPETYICHHSKIIWGKRLNNAKYAFGYGAKYVQISKKQKSSKTDSDPTTDLRRHPRRPIAKQVTFTIGNKSYDGLMTDISRNGCFIENSEFLKVGQILELDIPGTKFIENNRLKIEVVRLSPIGIGAKFKSIIIYKPQS